MKKVTVNKEKILSHKELVDSIDLTGSHKIEMNPDGARVAGIYFLYNNDDLVYIGMSTNVFVRICSHVIEKTKRFTHFSFMPAGSFQGYSLSSIEKLLIYRFNPVLNTATITNIERKFLTDHDRKKELKRIYNDQ